MAATVREADQDSFAEMRIILQFDTRDLLISLADLTTHEPLQKAFLGPADSLVGKSFLGLVAVEDRERVMGLIRKLGPLSPVSMASHSYQEDSQHTRKLQIKTVFTWICQPTATPGFAGRALVQAVSQPWFLGFDGAQSSVLVNAALRNLPDTLFRLSKDLVYRDYFAKVRRRFYHPLFFVPSVG